MRKIVQKELDLSGAGTPVIVYVSPGGARAASAGVWISEAADVLAMAPETNIGSSTPIELDRREPRQRPPAQGDQRRSCLAPRAREEPWAKRRLGRQGRARRLEPDRRRGACGCMSIDLVSPSLPALLRTIDGRTTVPAHLTLHTAGAAIVNAPAGVRDPLPLDAAQPEPRLAPLPRRDRRASASRSSTPARSSPARSARSRWCSRSSGSTCCRSPGPGSRS